MQLDLDKISEVFSNRIAQPVDIKRFYSVAVPLIFNKKTNQWEIIYELRSKKVSQPNEVSFPGGRLEEGETFEEACVRETCEELLISKDKIRVLGELDYLVTTGVLMIRCFLVQIKDIDLEDIRPNEDEVEEIFTVPLQFFFDNKPLESELLMSIEDSPHFPYDMIPNGKKYNFSKAKNIILFYNYQGRIIWGFTAKMTNSCINTLKKLELV